MMTSAFLAAVIAFSRFGEQASEACNAMAAGVEELQGTGKKAQWREELAGMTESIMEDGKTIPGFEDICAPSGRAGGNALPTAFNVRVLSFSVSAKSIALFTGVII